jgi:hypothetical protein
LRSATASTTDQIKISAEGWPTQARFWLEWGGWLDNSQQYTLADAIKSLKQVVSRRLIGDAEHFWQKRYYDFNIRELPHSSQKQA